MAVVCVWRSKYLDNVVWRHNPLKNETIAISKVIFVVFLSRRLFFATTTQINEAIKVYSQRHKSVRMCVCVVGSHATRMAFDEKSTWTFLWQIVMLWHLPGFGSESENRMSKCYCWCCKANHGAMAFNGAKLLVLATTHLIYMHATGFLWFVPNSDPLNLFTGRGSTPKKLKHTEQ